MNVWVLHLEHRHGDGGSVHATEQLANAALTAWVDEYWEKERETRDIPKPDDPAEAIDVYFELVASETYTLEEVTIDGLDSAAIQERLTKWAAQRRLLVDREGAGDNPKPGDWEASDDTGIEILRDLATTFGWVDA